MNARGGPGIVLASTAYAAGIIDESFFVTLVMLSVVTSLLAGAWLERAATALGGLGPARRQTGTPAIIGEAGTAV